MDTLENLDNYHEAYETSNKFFDENNFFLEHFGKKLIKTLRENAYDSVLSLGIGHQVVNEIILNEFSHGMKKQTILEGSSEIIKQFSSRFPSYVDKIELIHTYFETFETEEQYDIIEMGFILEHVDDPAYILQKFKSFLKPNGTLFIGVPNAKSLHRLIGFEAGLLKDIYMLSDFDKLYGHKRYFDLPSISKLVLDSGLKIKSTSGLLLKPITTSQMAQLGWKNNIYDALLKIGDNYPELSNCILIEAVN